MKFVPALPLIGFLASSALAQSIYNVSIDTTPLRGTSGRLIFDVTSNSPLTNRVDILNFVTDGTVDLPETSGTGLVTGDIVQGLNPARRTRLKANGFLTELVIPFASFGEGIEFILNASETAPRGERPPDQFSLTLVDSKGTELGMPNFSIAITGERGGRLSMGGRTPGRHRLVRAAQDSSDAVAVLLRSDAANARRGSSATITLTPAWTPDDPSAFADSKVFEGELTEYCNRRCAGEVICTGGAFALSVGEDRYPLDELGNLKAQVAIVDQGRDPRLEGPLGRARVVGVLQGTVLTVREVSVN